MLIYFDRPTQDRAIAVLNRLLRAERRVVRRARGNRLAREPRPGVDERAAGLRVSKGRRRAARAETEGRPSRAPLAPRRRSARRPAPCVARAQRPRPAAAASPRRRAAIARRPIRPRTSTRPRGSPIKDTSPKRPACCEEHLRRRGPSATAFYLLGLVRDATGNHAEAAAYYRKALYLDPNHYDALIHLALLMEKQGDAAGRAGAAQPRAPAGTEEQGAA